ncbi:DJ-1/PfpI family protein [bacterium]|nr:DJ-1/PfpI family protein [bacterium]
MATRRNFLVATATSLTGAALSQVRGQEVPKEEEDRSADDLHRVMMGNETIAMLIYDRFTALDLFGPHHFLRSMMGAKVHLVAKTLEPVKSDLGVLVTPTTTLADCPKDLTILFVPGGTEGTLAAAKDEEIRRFIADRGSRAKWVTSVCTGAIVLGAAGLLMGYNVTTHWLAMGALQSFGANPVKERVVIDRNRITGAGVTAGLDFALTLVSKLRNDAYAQGVQLMSEYDPRPPFHAGSPDSAPKGLTEMLRHMQGPFENAAKALGKDLAKDGMR